MLQLINVVEMGGKKQNNNHTTDLKQTWLSFEEITKNKACQVSFSLTYFTEPFTFILGKTTHDLLQKTDKKPEDGGSFIHRLHGFRTLRMPGVSSTPAADSCVGRR